MFPIRRALLAVSLLAGVSACNSSSKQVATEKSVVPSNEEIQAKAPQARLTDYEKEVARLSRELYLAKAAAKAQPDSWLRMSNLAARYLDHARLTHDKASYDQAEQAIAKAFTLAPDGKGPYLARAAIRASLHRFAEADEDASRVRPNPLQADSAIAEATALRADVAYQRGDFKAALRGLHQAVSFQRGYGTLSRLAYVHGKMGHLAQADGLYVEAMSHLALDQKRTRAWVELQRGVLDLENDKLAEARDHFQKADAIFSGWWLVEEHLAETTALLGDAKSAIAMYRDIVARTNHPEFMDALAELLEISHPKEAASLRKRAGDLYEAGLKRFPEATIGHAFEHFFAGGDYERAVDLAKRDHDLRPGPEAKLRLARAYAAVGKWEDASKTIQAVQASDLSDPQIAVVALQIQRRQNS